MSAELPPLTPEGLASSDLFADGSWRDGEGRSLLAIVLAELGAEAGYAVWRAAERLFEGRGFGRAHAGFPIARHPDGGTFIRELHAADRPRRSPR